MPRWLRSLEVYRDRRMLTLLLLGFSSGLPLFLVYSTLSFWLLEEGMSLEAVGAFSAAAFPYSLKFLWAPVIDRVPLGALTRRLGQRRSWMLLTQLAVTSAIVAVGLTDPLTAPLWTFGAATLIAAFSASQDVVIDAYRVELLEDDEQGAGAAIAVFGYRIGMLVAGAGALYLASGVGSWPLVYGLMAGCMAVGVITTLSCREPVRPITDLGVSADATPGEALRAQIKDAVWGPLRELMKRRGWLLFLLFIMLFKLGDSLASKMVNPLLFELGFSKADIASVVKLYGTIASLVGVALGGWVVRSLGVVKALWVAGILQMLSNFAFVWQAMIGHSIPALMLTISVEYLTGGIGTAVFVAYLSSLCNRAYTATQYALLTAVSGLMRTAIGSVTGVVAQAVGWAWFFTLTAAAALPGLGLLYVLIRQGWTGIEDPPDEEQVG